MNEDGWNFVGGGFIIGAIALTLALIAAQCSVAHKTTCTKALDGMSDLSGAEKTLFIERCMAN